MNIWVQMLQEVPASVQRLIARFQRISLPRRCPPAERHRRLRQALCHAHTVQVVVEKNFAFAVCAVRWYQHLA